MIKALFNALKNVFPFAPSRNALLNTYQFQNLQFTAIDFELTSLDQKVTQITSVGFVTGSNGVVDLSTSDYYLVKTTADLGQSPVIHGLTEEALNNGVTLPDALNALLPKLNESILVFHNASLDLAALHNVFVSLDLPKTEVMYIDTLKLAVYQLSKQHQVLPSHCATLLECCERLGLPSFVEHNALDDAMATMSLLFAQLSELGVQKHETLKVLKHTGAVGRFTLG